MRDEVLAGLFDSVPNHDMADLVQARLDWVGSISPTVFVAVD